MSKLFSDILGQKQAVSVLSAQLSSSNLSHGYLILGNEGTGRGYLALELARYILCEKHTEDDCEDCQKFLIGNHPDFIYIDGRDGIKIETVREAVERINLSPNLSNYKVLLLSRAENMGIEAANALLKTLEEPPADSIIILTAISEKSLTETIVSRVQKIKLNQIPARDIEEILSKDFTKAEIKQVADISEGSIGEAKKLLENPDYQTEKRKIFADVETILTSESVIEKFKIIENHEKEKNLKSFFNIFAGVIFQMLDAKISLKNPQDMGRDLSTANLLALSKKILKIYANLDYNINLRLAMEELILEQLIYD